MPNPKLVPFASQIRIWYFGEELIESRFVREFASTGIRHFVKCDVSLAEDTCLTA